MKNIPVFTTENGAASLILKQIPYYGTAYIKMQSTLQPKELLDECVAFCKMAGAEAIYASNHEYLEQYPFHTAIWRMTRLKDGLDDADAMLFPVTEQTLADWLSLYNRRMARVPNASYMDQADGRKLLTEAGGYFVHRDGKLLGIGKVAADEIEAVVSVLPGMGETVVRALSTLITSEVVSLTVASENTAAVRLYERMGFVRTEEVSRWYKVFEEIKHSV